jgi:hypothetical protein
MQYERMWHARKKRAQKGGNHVPRKGYRTLRVTDDIHDCLKKQAKETNHTIPEYIKHLIGKNNQEKTEK